MKALASVAAFALAAGLASSPAFAAHHEEGENASAATEVPQTPEGAAAFVDAVEKDLFD